MWDLSLPMTQLRNATYNRDEWDKEHCEHVDELPLPRCGRDAAEFVQPLHAGREGHGDCSGHPLAGCLRGGRMDSVLLLPSLLYIFDGFFIIFFHDLWKDYKTI